MLGSFSKVSSVSMSKGCDESSYIFKITKGTARRVSVKVTGEFCNIEDEESFFHHNGEFFSIMPAKCSFCEGDQIISSSSLSLLPSSLLLPSLSSLSSSLSSLLSSVTNCRLCGEYSDCKECGSAMCGSCVEDSFVCSMCEDCYCENCDSDFVTCDGCDDQICSNCADEEYGASVCSLCETQYCSSCADFICCEQCDEQICSNCAENSECCTCDECGSFYCVDCKDDINSCDGCQKCICSDCCENSVTCSGCDSFYCEECADCSTRACSHCNNFYCLASAVTWKKCKKCHSDPQVCDDCRGDYFVRCKMCKKLSLCLECSNKTDSCCKGKKKRKWKKKHVPKSTDDLPPLIPVSENDESYGESLEIPAVKDDGSTVTNDESLKSLTKE